MNILIYGCESCADKESDQYKLEVCHYRFLQSILKITIHNIKEKHIKKSMIREKLNIYSLTQVIKNSML